MRKASLLLFAIIAQIAVKPVLSARSYVPLMEWSSPGQLPIYDWKATRAPDVQHRSINPRDRPQLGGQWSKDVELLEDALLRKRKSLGGSHNKARQIILNTYASSSQSAARLRGIFAEAVYLELHPNEGYVSKPNAPHNDVYRWIEGERIPQGGQIKTMRTFSGAGYLAKMKQDYLASRFIVPDDHVEPLKNYLSEQEHKFITAGEGKLADEARLQFAKVKPLGTTSDELESRLRSVFRRVVAEKAAPYVSLGAAAGIGLAPIFWNYGNGTITSGHAIYQTTRVVSLMGTGYGTDMVLASVKGGALRGVVKGNIITGAAIFAVETGFLVYENGGKSAFQEARFWEELGGSVSALTIALAVGTPVAISVTILTESPPIGLAAGIVVGSAASMIGHVAGKNATRVLLDSVTPEIARKAESDAVAEVNNNLREIEKKLVFTAIGN